MTIKQWPKNGDTVICESLLDPVIESICRAYKLERINSDGIYYDGYEVGEQHIVPSVEHTLSKTGLEQNLENGRDALTVLVSIAFQLGVEQGKRHQNKEFETILSIKNLLNMTK